MLKGTSFYLINNQTTQHKMKTEFKKAGDVMFHEIAESYLINMAHGRELAEQSETGFMYWWRDVVDKLNNGLELIAWRMARQVLLSSADEATNLLKQKLPSSFRLAQEKFAEEHNKQIIQQLKKEYYPGI